MGGRGVAHGAVPWVVAVLVVSSRVQQGQRRRRGKGGGGGGRWYIIRVWRVYVLTLCCSEIYDQITAVVVVSAFLHYLQLLSASLLAVA